MGEQKESSYERIKQTAIRQFAAYGYNGTSLAAIAEAVKIHKSTIYAHFNSKEELFYTCMQEAANKRFKQYEALLENMKGASVTEILYAFLNQYDEIGEQDPDAFFHERFAYFPPEELKEEVHSFSSNVVIVHIREILEPIFQTWASDHNVTEEEKNQALITFICLYDGLMIERLIGSREKYQYRLKYTWPFFEKGLLEMTQRKDR